MIKYTTPLTSHTEMHFESIYILYIYIQMKNKNEINKIMNEEVDRLFTDIFLQVDLMSSHVFS